jgi:hypothetical protein
MTQWPASKRMAWFAVLAGIEVTEMGGYLSEYCNELR